MTNIPIKTLSCFILITLTIFSCESPNYISGKLEGTSEESIKIYLIQAENLNEISASYFGKVIDSADVNSEGLFSFKNISNTKTSTLLELALKVPEKYPNYIQTEDPSKSNYMPIFWESGETINITAKLSEFQKSFSIGNPSDINKELLNLRDVNQKAYQNYLKGKHWQIEEGNGLLEKEHAILQYKKELMQFADSTKHLIPALVALRWISPENDYERTPEILVNQCKKWQEKEPEHIWVKQLCEQSKSSNLPILIGSEFPDIELPMITKDTLSLKKELGNKITIIDVWASWCAPCRIENRDILAPIWGKYHNKGLQIIAFGLESSEVAWKSAVKRDGADLWLQASDLQGDDTPFLKRIRIQTIPANFILDDKGVVLAKNVHGQALIDWIDNYLKNEKSAN